MKSKTSLKINAEQDKAIKFGEGPLLIIAGAGTGKTTVVTERIKYLILSGRAKTSELLALTFTEKAAREMEERIDISMPYGYTQMWIMTFHSFCDRILRREALHIGLDPNYKLMTEAESIQLVRQNIFEMNLDYFRPLGNPSKFISGMLQHFSRLQDEDVTPEDYLTWAKSIKPKSDEEKIEAKKWLEMANSYKFYDDLKTKQGFMDFGDLITKTLKLLRDRPNILLEYKKQFKYILVDEFQDTNFAQNELVKLLSGKNGNINVVADDDQSVYRFRGAAVSNVIQFRKSFPKTKIVVLTKNYRSTQEILDKSYDLIQFNNPDRLEVVEKIDKKLKSQTTNIVGGVEFIHADRVENEADLVSKKISELVADGGYSYKDFAILVRANSHSEPFMKSFDRHGIPYQLLGPGRLFKQPEIIDLISYLKVLYNFEDSISFYRILSIDYFNISGRDLAAMGIYSKKYNISLFETAEKIDELEVEDDTKERIKKILNIIKKHLDIAKNNTAGQLLYYFLDETGLMQKLLSPETPDAEKVALNVAKLFDKFKSFESNHELSGVREIVDYLDMAMELGEGPVSADIDWSDVNAVNILTTHSSKGLEFKVVFVVNLVSQRFPTIERREQIPIPDKLVKEVLPIGDYHIEEERRLFYVAMTRAKEKLFLTAADYYGEGKRVKKLSPFIFEALGDKSISAEVQKVSHEQLSFLDYKPNTKVELYEKSQLHIDYLSYSQIENFKTCPVHFKLLQIYKLPTSPSASQSFGISIHASLKDFYNSVGAGKKATDKLFFNTLTKNWVKVGYGNRKQEADFLKKGRGYLSGYLKLGFNKSRIPVAMEQKFMLPLNGKEKGERGLKIGGTIDRVDDLGNGEIEIIDYKTGATIPGQRDVDKNLQLSIYALAATKIPDFPFNKKPEQVRLSLYYLDIQEKISTTRTLKQLEVAEKEIFEVRREIETSDFKCSNHMFCQMGCEFSIFCKSDAD